MKQMEAEQSSAAMTGCQHTKGTEAPHETSTCQVANICVGVISFCCEITAAHKLSVHVLARLPSAADLCRAAACQRLSCVCPWELWIGVLLVFAQHEPVSM